MTPACADIVGNVWKIVAREGDAVAPGDPICVLETMKMEIPVASPVGGHVLRILVHPGQIVQEGDPVAHIDETVGV